MTPAEFWLLYDVHTPKAEDRDPQFTLTNEEFDGLAALIS